MSGGSVVHCRSLIHSKGEQTIFANSRSLRSAGAAFAAIATIIAAIFGDLRREGVIPEDRVRLRGRSKRLNCDVPILG